MRTLPALLVLAAAACSSGDPAEQRAEPRKAEAPRPMRVALGDCAPPTVSFVSGPRPRPFTLGPDAKTVIATPEPGGAAGDLSPGLDVSGALDPGYGGTGVGIGIRGSGGGGGYGHGVIGTGRIGRGRGGLRGRAPTAPSLDIGMANVQGNLDKAIIRRYIRRRASQLQYCYEKGLLADPTLAGTVMTQFRITPDGQVTGVATHGVSPAVASCVRTVIERIEFPKPRGGDTVMVNYPFIFRRADPPLTQAGIISLLPPVPGSAGSAGSASSTPAPTPHSPGAGSPLRGQEPALTACLRKQPRPHGVFVVDLAHGPSGAQVLVHGLDGDAGLCVVDLAGKLAGPSAPAQRCSIAFGDLPPSEAPAVELTADELRFLDKRIAPLASLASGTPRIDALHDAAAAYATPSADPVSLRGPVLLRALDATPMKLVHRVVDTMAAAGIDLVLARRDPTGWKLLRSIGPLPIVPVPAGTGAPWSHRTGTGPSQPTLTILVTPDKIQLRITGVPFSLDIPRAQRGHDLATLDRSLAEHRGARFADRDDLQLTADPSVPYGDVASILELAAGAGFPYARLVTPAPPAAPQ